MTFARGLLLKDAVTGEDLLVGGNIEIDHSSPTGQWQLWQFIITNAYALVGRTVSLDYNSIVDGDLSISTMRVDGVELITNCAGSLSSFAPSNAIIIEREVMQNK
ncbi:MAG: hypothetical protein M5U05_12970 [Anaerolineales bacterium]|jgi:hypothetical protein|nr:hypothetical protein [Anaerolineales bacterium]